MYIFTIHIQSNIHKRFIVVIKEIGICLPLSSVFFRGLFGGMGFHILDTEHPNLHALQDETVHIRYFDAERFKGHNVYPLHIHDLAVEYGLNMLLYTMRPRLMILGFYKTETPIQHRYISCTVPLSLPSDEQIEELQEHCVYEEIQSFVQLCVENRQTLDVTVESWKNHIYLFTQRICTIMNPSNRNIQTCEQIV
jgi:hypothetical protein